MKREERGELIAESRPSPEWPRDAQEPVTRDEFTRLDGANRPDSQPKGLDLVTLRPLAKHLTAPESDALDQSDYCHRLLKRPTFPQAGGMSCRQYLLATGSTAANCSRAGA